MTSDQPRLTGWAAANNRPAQVDLFNETETDPAELPAFRDPRDPSQTVRSFNTPD